ncbi:MAG: hypothetical protein Q9169_002763 [Polycauliona sp. 2 TL-2023]
MKADVVSQDLASYARAEELGTLPKGLSETYDNILGKVDKDHTRKVRRSLTWLAVSARPLSPIELLEPISINPGDKQCKRNDKHKTIEELLGFCVKEYLQSTSSPPSIASYRIDQQRAHQELAYTCLTYLALDAFGIGPVQEYTEYDKRITKFPLLRYTAKHASAHFRHRRLNPTGCWVRVLFPLDDAKDRMNNHLKYWRQARDSFGYHEPLMIAKGTDATPLFYASHCGLTSVVKRLLAFGVDVNINWFYGTALQAASAEDHLEIVEELLDHGAEVNITDEELGTALQAVCIGGHLSTVTRLVAARANVNQISGFCGTALAAAAYRGSGGISSLLLKSGAGINIFAGRYGTALLAASYRGRVAIAQLLLEGGADVNIQGTRYGNALKVASEEEYGTALQSAGRAGSVPVVSLLLDNGAAVNAIGGYYSTALQAAARTNIGVTRVLLDAGADDNLVAGQYGTALTAATYFGKADIVKMLVDRGAAFNAASVQAAVLEGYEDTGEFPGGAYEGTGVISTLTRVAPHLWLSRISQVVKG